VKKLRLKDKVALITGAGRGIGRATALLFAKEGAKVVVDDVNEKNGRKTVELIRNIGGTATFVRGDVSKEVEVKKMVEAAVNEYGRLDILHNNAGVEFDPKELVDWSEKEYNRVLDVNLKGIFFVSKYVIPEMVKHGGGSIINAASQYAFTGAAKYTVYCGSKGGVVSITKAMAIELAPHNIRVNCICPGVILTPMIAHGIEKSSKASGVSEDEIRRNWEKTFPIKRFGKPEEIAYAALYLASDESSYTTGATLIVDGGTSAQ
jgi:NAD(P)-dependent dehydrogenase (short-subunit alcohol dehydrogenase family)